MVEAMFRECLTSNPAHSNPVLVAIKEAISQVKQEIQEKQESQEKKQIQEKRGTKQAMELVQTRLIKNVTRSLITSIIQESTDSIYQFEDDSITLADQVLISVLKKEVRQIVGECAQEQYSFMFRKSDLNRSSFNNSIIRSDDLSNSLIIPSEYDD
mmetsp:Transcript_40599/g.61856  ORF Transcript_40599/g.61856 Transcript_40599/m.61856 type:complete len:156 (-) Transcript_40599:273-740(-)